MKPAPLCVMLAGENASWTWEQIDSASTFEDIDQVECDIKNDIFENEDWTTSEICLDSIRQFYMERRREILNAERRKEAA